MLDGRDLAGDERLIGAWRGAIEKRTARHRAAVVTALEILATLRAPAVPDQLTQPVFGTERTEALSSQEHVYFHSEHSVAEFAAAIGPAVGMAVIRGGRGETFLSRPLPDGGAVGGELRANEMADPGEPSFLDVFPLVLDLGITIGDRGRQLAEARALFTELAGVSPVPVALVRGYDFLLGAADGGKKLVWFPENVTPYVEDRETWLPFQPAAHG